MYEHSGRQVFIVLGFEESNGLEQVMGTEP